MSRCRRKECALRLPVGPHAYFPKTKREFTRLSAMLSFKGIGPGRRERSGTNRKERWQSKSQMADADPSALASPRFAFSDQGVPAISRPGFNLGGPIQAPCLRPARTPLSSVALMPCGSVGPPLFVQGSFSIHGNLRCGSPLRLKHRLRSRIPPLRWSGSGSRAGAVG